MKFNRTTISLVVFSVGLSVIVYLAQIKPQGFNLDSKTEQEIANPKIFSFTTEDIQQITIYTNQETIVFDREDTDKSPWLMIQPQKLVASDGAISFLVNLFPQAQNKVELPATEDKKQEYGLLDSTDKIELTLTNNDRYTIILGNPNFDDSQIYAQVIFPNQMQKQTSIFLVSKSFRYAIERDFEQWKKSPFDS